MTVELSNIAFSFVGNVVPDEPGFHGGNFNRSANMWQTNLLCSMAKAGMPASLILSQLLIRAYPHSRTIWSHKASGLLADGSCTTFVPFLNISVLRPLTVGLFVLLELLRWGWRNRRTKHRVVLSYNLTEPPGIFTLLASKLINARSVALLNDVMVPGGLVPDTLFWRVDFWLTKRLAPRFDRVIVITDKIAADFAPDRPCLRMSGGISGETLLSFENERPDAIHKSIDTFTIVTAGTLSKTNGILEILEAFALLKSPKYRLRIAGRGELEEVVRKAAQKDLRIEYCGNISLSEVLTLYKSADVLVNMRLTKQLRTEYVFPSKTYEYMASGVPVITTSVGHVEEEYGSFVFLLKDETGDGLAGLIEEVASLDQSVRRTMGTMARNYIKAHYSWSVQAQRVVHFITSDVC